MYIVIKQNINGALTTGGSPKTYMERQLAIEEATRLASQDATGASFLVFKAVCKIGRAAAPLTFTEIN